ncbi:flavin reductase family protein [Micromonospora sp. NPDC003241]
MGSPVGAVRPVLDSVAFRDAMSLLAAPLTVVTTRDREGRRWGFTASSVVSASLAPPLLIVGIGHESSCFTAMVDAAEFAVNLLGEEQQATARRFAARGADRFAGSDCRDLAGSTLPYLGDAHAVFRCTLADRLTVGDHDLLVGHLTEVHVSGQARPLLWYRRGFHVPVPGQPAGG